MDVTATRLPRWQDRFVGRQRELTALRALFSGGARLVTLTGPAGIGKTRLALEFASERGPAVFSEVSEARESGDVASALMRSLCSSFGKVPVELASVGAELDARGRLLVILDGFEQAAPGGTDAIAQWLSAAPNASFLVTSRELLRLGGEHVLEVPSLSLPQYIDARSEAMDLILDRLGRIRVGYVPAAEELRALASLVRELDGFPLGIELAAARMSTLSPQAILERLVSRFQVLQRVGGPSNHRHAALRTSLDDSWELLDSPERWVLAQCSVFVGGFTLASAEAILDLAAFPSAPPVLDVLQRLREKSLLHMRRSGDDSLHERFGLYRSIRDYARMRLDEGSGTAAAHARHAAHYISEAQTKDLTRRVAERDNVFAAVERLLSTQPMTPETAILIVQGGYAMETLLHAREFRALFEKGGSFDLVLSALATTNVDPVWLPRAKYLHASTQACAERSESLTCVLADARSRGDRALEARVLRSLGSVDGRKGRFDTALRGLSRAHETGREAGDFSVEAATLRSMGNVAREAGRFSEAERHYERALSICQTIGNAGHEASVLADVAFLRVELGQLDGARSDCTHALGLHATFGNGAHWVLALIHHEQGDLEKAAREYEHAFHAAREVHDEIREALARGYLALLRHEQGDSRTAQSHLSPLPDTALRLGYGRHHALLSAFLGTVQSALDAVECAQRSFDAAASALERNDRYGIAIHVLRAHVDLALARNAQRTGNAAAARGHRAAAEARLVDAPAAFDSYVLRLAQRLVARAFPEDLPARISQSGVRALRVERGGRWLYTPNGERFDVDTHRVVRALLCALVEARIRAPGVALSPSDLCDAGWPGERVAASAAKNRLHVSLTRLRKLGLRDLIVRRDDGYLLDPDVAVVWTTS